MVDNDPQAGKEHGHSSIEPAPAAKTNWLPWIIGGVVLLGLLLLLMRGCDTTRDDATPVATNDMAVTDPSVPTGTVAYDRDAFNDMLGGTQPLPATFGLDSVNFATGSSTVNDNAKSDLADLAAALKARSTARISLRGYADPAGDAAANQKLSADRANAVRDALIKGGASAGQIVTSAEGETGDQAIRANRRVELTLTQR